MTLFERKQDCFDISEQVISITVSQIERGIENPCVDGSIPPLMSQLFAVWFNSGGSLFTSFDFNAACLPVGFRWRAGHLFDVKKLLI
jgi:hypothetical protein